MTTKYKKIFDDYLAAARFAGDLGKVVDYVIRGDGHRFRPQLTLAWCELCGGSAYEALPLALAIECIHTMSVVHDDLPCMDNSPLRRGKASVHVEMGECAAILCGDKLLSMAFELVSNSNLDCEKKVEVVKLLSKAACDMADAQFLELSQKTHTDAEWVNIHMGKTASLISASCMIGAITAGGSNADVDLARIYGESFGLGYQLLDDIKDNDGITLSGNTNKRAQVSEYISKCNVGANTEPRRFLTELSKAVLV